MGEDKPKSTCTIYDKDLDEFHVLKRKYKFTSIADLVEDMLPVYKSKRAEHENGY